MADPDYHAVQAMSFADVLGAMPGRVETSELDGTAVIALSHYGDDGFAPIAETFWWYALPTGWRVHRSDVGVLYLVPAGEGLDEIRAQIRSRPGAAERIAAQVDEMNRHARDAFLARLRGSTVEELYEIITDILLDARHYNDTRILSEAYPVAQELCRRAGFSYPEWDEPR